MNLCRFEKDERSIPVTGDSSGLVAIDITSIFSVQNGKVFLLDSQNDGAKTAIGSDMQYLVEVM